jgi:hypothetical protein
MTEKLAALFVETPVAEPVRPARRRRLDA